jgi:hypothetical protein
LKKEGRPQSVKAKARAQSANAAPAPPTKSAKKPKRDHARGDPLEPLYCASFLERKTADPKETKCKWEAENNKAPGTCNHPHLTKKGIEHKRRELVARKAKADSGK